MSELVSFEIIPNTEDTHLAPGPRELSIADPEAIVPVLGSASRTSKGPFYGSMEQSLHTTRNKEFHRLRRRVWDNAFKV